MPKFTVRVGLEFTAPGIEDAEQVVAKIGATVAAAGKMTNIKDLCLIQQSLTQRSPEEPEDGRRR